MILYCKGVFLAVNESLHWLNNVSCLFFSFLLVEYNCSLINVD
jgi:hypothetical protein